MKALLTSCLLLSLSAAATEVINNFSFDNGPQFWNKVAHTGKYNTDPAGTNIPADPSLVTLDYTAAGDYDPALPPNPLPKALRVSGRRWHTDGIRQDIIGNLPASPNPAGEPYRFRLKIKVDEPCFVRCLLMFGNGSANDTPMIVAEKVIREAQIGQWIVVEGVRNVVWPAAFTPTQARLSLDVGQIYKEKLAVLPTPANPNPAPIYLPYPSGMWPSYTLDYISMDRDMDLDGLSDAEEAALVPPTLASNPDSDGDGLPDKWEVDHGLLWAPQPGAPAGNSDDRDADKDGDGFTNWEEYWAATDPNEDPMFPSYPGKTANTHATDAAKAVARALALAPSKGKRLVGQHVNSPLTEYQTNVVALADRVELEDGAARWPAILSLTIEGQNGPLDVMNAANLGRPYATSGRLVLMKWAMWNPWTGGANGSQGAVGEVDIPALVDPASPNYNLQANIDARTAWFTWLDDVAAELASYLDPGMGGHPDNVVIFRIVSEMTGDWNWYGHRTYEEYKALWHFVYNRFTNEKHLNHLLWCYESAQSEHHFANVTSKPVPADYYYPGDDEVDIMGHNLYDDDWVLPNDLNALFRSYPKIYGFPQAGAAANKTNPVYEERFDNRLYVTRIAEAYPRASFFIPWNTFTGPLGTVYHAIVSNPGATEMMTDPSIITDTWMSPWQQWARGNFGTFTAPGSGDADLDGLNETTEYAFASSPFQPSPPPVKAVPSIIPAPLSVTFMRNLSATDATFTIEAASDLSNWQSMAQAIQGGAWTILPGCSVSEAADGTVIFTDNVSPGSGIARFVRLAVEVE